MPCKFLSLLTLLAGTSAIAIAEQAPAPASVNAPTPAPAVAAPAPAPAVPAPLWVPSDAPNTPMGVGRGVFPGRVTWIRDLAATPWDGKTGNWWDDGTGIDQAAVDRMMARSVQSLAGAADEAVAWDKLFRYHNRTQGRGDKGYDKSEKIALKINCNNAYAGYGDVDPQIDQSPQTVFTLLTQLIKVAGVPQEQITVYEAVRVIPDRVFKKAHEAYPGVVWVDSKGDGSNGRQPVQWQKNVFKYSIPEPLVGTDAPKCVQEATYLINMTLVKGHPTTGVTLTAKNHYGSVNKRDHRVYTNAWKHKMGIYSPFVDMIGSKELGGKTVLYILDGLYGLRDVNDEVAVHGHWNKLFNGEWMASIFMSQDPIAIDSVGLDFLRVEFPMGRDKPNTPQAMINSDNYLHEGALADKAPSGIAYAPDGTPLPSLGVHEHWNNEVEKKYSRNLGQAEGIELFVVSPK